MLPATTTYTRTATDKVLASIAMGHTLAQACKLHDVNVYTWYQWVEKDYDDLKERYNMAKISHMEHLVLKYEQIVEAPLSEDEKTYPQAVKLRELRTKRIQWELEKRFRRVYGNQVTIEQKHVIDLAPILKRVQERMEAKGVNLAVKATDKPLELSKVVITQEHEGDSQQ